MPHAADRIRNVALVGHRGSGKTSLHEALLFEAGATTRLGSVADGTTVSDADEDEKSRGMSISASLASFEWRDVKVNLIDTPGEPSFIADCAGRAAGVRVRHLRRQRRDGRRGLHAPAVGARAGAARRPAGLREHARPRAGRLLPRAGLAQGGLRAARRGHRDPDRLRARAQRPDRPRGHEGLHVRRRRRLHRDPDPGRARRSGAGVPREAHGRGRGELRGADGALPRGRGDLPRRDRPRARGGHRLRPHLPGHLRRRDDPPGRQPPAGRGRRRPPVARAARAHRGRGGLHARARPRGARCSPTCSRPAPTRSRAASTSSASTRAR